MALKAIPHAFEAAVKQPATATLLFLHGLGDSGTGWATMLQEKLAPTLPSLQIIAPHAPVRNLTVARGQRMPMWFDILVEGSRERPDMQDQKGMERSRIMVESIIQHEVEQGRRVVLAGFSQGAVLTLYSGLQSQYPLAGLMLLSGFVPLETTLASLKSPKLPTRLPIWQGHGTADRVIDISYGRKLRDFLRSPELGLGDDDPIEYNEYEELEHSASPKELEDMADWLQRILPIETRSAL